MLHFILTVSFLSSAACLHPPYRQKRSWIIDSFAIEEGHPGPFPYELGKIDLEREYGIHFDLLGQGVDLDPKGVLTIDKETGVVFVHKPVDYEEHKVLKLKFEAIKSDYSIDTKLGVEITITDINDNPPLFQRSLYELDVAEETAQGADLLTVWAFDRDQRGSPNSTFHYELKSVTPKTENTQFFIDEDNGKISFRGCLDHEVADKFTLLIEAKDHGDVISLSSFATVVIQILDRNNHLPTISGQTGSGKVKEGEAGTSPLRIHVTDGDTPNSPAWRVKYSINAEGAQHFQIETDPVTNDGVLTVQNPLDYENVQTTDLTISVENEAPFFSCSVKERTTSGLWRVDVFRSEDSSPALPSVTVTIEVEDANDPPDFLVTVKEVMLEENSPAGTEVAKVTARDPDSSFARDFVYKVGDDPGGWVKVDPTTGDIITVKTTDRESPHVVDGIYTVLIYAVDSGEPPMTGTATVNVHVADVNDNVPQLEVDFADMCVSDDDETANITAFDLDADPFGGPFTFELLGDVEGKWRLVPSYGYTAGLVKEPGVHVGPHEVSVRVRDMQGQFGVYNLSVIVCDCSVSPNCRGRRDNATATSAGAIGVVLLALLLLLVGLLLSSLITCKKRFIPLQLQDSEGTTVASSTEEPGTDCKVPLNVQTVSSDNIDEHNEAQHLISTKMSVRQATVNKRFSEYHEQMSRTLHDNWTEWATGTGTAGGHLYHQGGGGFVLSGGLDQMLAQRFGQVSRGTHFVHNSPSEGEWSEAVLALLQRRLISLEETPKELLDYEPQLYSEEGDAGSLTELEDICLPEQDSLDTVLNNLSPEFNTLALVCTTHQKR